MKKVICLTTLFVSFVSARADLVSIACGKDRDQGANNAEIGFFAEDVTLGENAEWGMSLNGSDLKGATAVFSHPEGIWRYIVTKTSKTSKIGKQYVFSVGAGCQDEGDTGHVTVFKVGGDHGRQFVKRLECNCASD